MLKTLVRSVAIRFSTVIAKLLTNSLEITLLRNYKIEFQESNCNGYLRKEPTPGVLSQRATGGYR